MASVQNEVKTCKEVDERGVSNVKGKQFTDWLKSANYPFDSRKAGNALAGEWDDMCVSLLSC